MRPRVRGARRAAVLLACLPACSPAQPDPPPAPPVAAATTRLDAALMARTLAAAQGLPRLRSLLVLRDGRPLAEHVLHGGAPLDRPVNIKSASKTILSALAGIAIARGVFTGTDQRVADVLRADLPADPDPRLARVTLGNLLSMQAGLERTSGEYYGRWVASPNWVRHALSRPFVAEPGGAMQYSTGSSHLVSAMLTRASGESTATLARRWLGEPLGIVIPPWTRDPQGIYFGGNEMRMSPRALARFGEMYRLGGVIDGRRVVPAAWVRESWRPRATSPWSGQGYGYGWFAATSAGHPVHFAWGYGGQMLFVVPDLALTVVMTSDPAPQPRGDHVDALHRLLDEGIVPAAVKGG